MFMNDFCTKANLHLGSIIIRTNTTWWCMFKYLMYTSNHLWFHNVWAKTFCIIAPRTTKMLNAAAPLKKNVEEKIRLASIESFTDKDENEFWEWQNCFNKAAFCWLPKMNPLYFPLQCVNGVDKKCLIYLYSTDA